LFLITALLLVLQLLPLAAAAAAAAAITANAAAAAAADDRTVNNTLGICKLLSPHICMHTLQPLLLQLLLFAQSFAQS
jgi:hypothetical protein